MTFFQRLISAAAWLAIPLALAAVPARAQNFTWSGASGGLWTTAGNWLPSGTPDTISETATVNNGGTATTINLDVSQTIGRFSVGYVTDSTSQTGNVILDYNGSPTTLTIGTSSTGGLLHVGSSLGASAPGSPNGTLQLEAGTTVSLIGGAFYLGTRQDLLTSQTGSNTTGAMSMVAGSTLNVGTDANRSLWEIGFQKAVVNNQVLLSTGTFSATGGDLTAYLSNLTVGSNNRGGGETNGSKGIGNLNLTSLTSATIDTHQLWVGTTNVGAADGTVTLGNNHIVRVGTDATAGAVLIGVSDSFASANPFGTNTNAIDGNLNMGAGSSLTIGTAAAAGSLTIGRNLGVRGTTIDREGNLVATGGTFAGYLSSLVVGSQEAPFESGKTFIADGTLDLRQAAITAFQVSGNATIGRSAVTNAQNSRGDVFLSQVNGSIGGALTVGDTDLGSVGLLELNGTHLTVGGNVNIDNTGDVAVFVPAASAGLSLTSLSTFAIGTGATYGITFEQNPIGVTLGSADNNTGIHYGLKWAGNKTSDLTALAQASKLIWDDTTFLTGSFNDAAGIFYDSGTDATYVGIYIVPEPGGLALAGIGSGFAAWLIRRGLGPKRSRVAPEC